MSTAHHHPEKKKEIPQHLDMNAHQKANPSTVSVDRLCRDTFVTLRIAPNDAYQYHELDLHISKPSL
jgi:hypothetical protein